MALVGLKEFEVDAGSREVAWIIKRAAGRVDVPAGTQGVQGGENTGNAAKHGIYSEGAGRTTVNARRIRWHAIRNSLSIASIRLP